MVGGGGSGGSGGDDNGNNLPDQPQICSRKGCQAVGIRPISSTNPSLYCLACLKMKRDAKNANRSKKRRQVRQKKYGLMGHITCKWVQEEHIRFQRNVLDIPFLKKEQYIVATFSPHFANQFILLRKMIPGSTMKELKKK